MAGSMKFVSYTTNRGDSFALWHDESNWEAVNGGAHDITPDNLVNHVYGIPENIEPRFAYYRSTSTVKVRKVAVATNTLWQDLVDGEGTRTFSSDGETFRFYRVEAEKIRPVVIEFDTGLNDGDDT